MRRLLIALSALALVSIATSAARCGPYYVRGDFYCADSTNDPAAGSCWGWDGANEMFDDGLHDDGLAGDGVYGASVPVTAAAGRHEFKIALYDWSEAYPTVPSDALANAVVYVTGPGELVHFRLHLYSEPGGWEPYGPAVATDSPMPEGTALEVIGSAPETGSWNSGVPLLHVGRRWQQVITLHTPGSYEFKIRALGTWSVVAFGYDYDNTQGRNAFYSTSLPDADVLFQLDEDTGRVRAIELGQVPARPGTWGELKVRYR